MVEERLKVLRGRLNRRQLKILTDYLSQIEEEQDDLLAPPVPAELEASIRIRKRTTWLPWEAEAVRKIERWHADVGHIGAMEYERQYFKISSVASPFHGQNEFPPKSQTLNSKYLSVLNTKSLNLAAIRTASGWFLSSCKVNFVFVTQLGRSVVVPGRFC